MLTAKKNFAGFIICILVSLFFMAAGTTPVNAEEPTKLLYGTDYQETCFAKELNYCGSGNIDSVEQISGSGEISGARIVENGAIRFRAAKEGDVTVRFTVTPHEGTPISKTISYRIIHPYELYSIECSRCGGNTAGSNSLNLSVENVEVNKTIFSMDIITWINGEPCFATEVTKTPTKADFVWTQSGTGQVSEISSDSKELRYDFMGVKVGDVTLTFSTTDGKWSQSVSFRIHPDMSKLPEIGFSNSKKIRTNGYDGGLLLLWSENPAGIQKSLNKVKRGDTYVLNEIRAISSDESILVPGSITWQRSYESETEDDLDFELHTRVLKAGTVTITIVDTEYEEPLAKITFSISEKTSAKCTEEWKQSCTVNTMQYGNSSLKVFAREGDTVELNYAGNVRKETVPPAGYSVTFSGIPVKKTGTTGTVSISRVGDGLTVNKTVKVKDSKVSLKIGKVKKSAKKLTGTLTRAKKGDYIKIKAGRKTYTKKVLKNASAFKFTQKIAKQKRGAKLTVTVYNKFKQVRCKKSIKVK